MRKEGSKYRRVTPQLTRRQFLGQLGLAGGAAAGFTALGWLSHSTDPVRSVTEVARQLREAWQCEGLLQPEYHLYLPVGFYQLPLIQT